MAAACATTASALSVPNGLSSRGGAAGLSSGNAFQTTSIVQQRPVTTRAHRMVAARASLGPEESKAAARREVLGSILAAGAALAFGGRAVADPLEGTITSFYTGAPLKVTPVVGRTNFSRTEKSEGKGEEIVSGVKGSASSAKSTLQAKGSELGEKAKGATSNLPDSPSLPNFSLPKPDLPKVDLPKFGK